LFRGILYSVFQSRITWKICTLNPKRTYIDGWRKLNFMNNHYPFELKPLPYAYDALEPFIDTKTMQLHHDRHLLTYINNLNAALKDYPELWGWSLEQLLYYNDLVPEKIRTAVKNNAGGVYNHNAYFAGMTNDATQKNQAAAPNLMRQINTQFGSFDNFKIQFKTQVLAVFGSGYTNLATDQSGQLNIINTPNQDTMLSQNLAPIILIDAWEHAYYLKHYNLRADYIDDWFNVLNLSQAEKNYIGVKQS